jgi:hypothetical protein
MSILDNPLDLAMAQYLARKVRDETAPATERMYHAVLLADFAGPTIVEMARQAASGLAAGDPPKPKYKWVNGARVKV